MYVCMYCVYVCVCIVYMCVCVCVCSTFMCEVRGQLCGIISFLSLFCGFCGIKLRLLGFHGSLVSSPVIFRCGDSRHKGCCKCVMYYDP